MAKNLKIRSYKSLKSRKRASGDFKANIRTGVSNINSQLISRGGGSGQKGETKNYDKLMDDMKGDYDNKIKALKKEADDNAKNQSKASDKELSDINNRLADSNKNVNALRSGISQELQKLQNRGQQSSQQGQQAGQKTGEEGKTQETTGASVTRGLAAAVGTGKTDKQLADEKAAKEKIAAEEEEKRLAAEGKDGTEESDDAAGLENNSDGITDENGKVVPQHQVSKVFKIGDDVPVGDAVYKITNLYAPRSGANSVSGRKSGVHSKGVDLVAYDNAGNKTNLPISFLDGEIVNIGLDGDGTKITPSQGSRLGYYVDIRSSKNPNKIIRIGHLDAGIGDHMEDWVGRQLKRGETIFEGGSMTGSGTGPHIKVYMSDVDENGQAVGNWLAQGNDPSPIIKDGLS